LQFGIEDVGPKVAKAFVDLVVQGLSGAIVQELIDVGLVPFLKVPNPSDSPGANAAWHEVFEVSMAIFPILVAAGLLATPFGEDGERDLWRQGFRVVTVVFLIAISRPLLGLAIDITNAVTLQLAPSSYTIGVAKGTFDGLGTFFLTANAYFVAAIVMLWSTAAVAILLTLRHVIVLFVYIGLPFLAVCWYADWGPMEAVSGFAAKVMRMGIYALLVGPLLSIALRALEVISEGGLVVAAGTNSLAVLWESLVIAALGPLMLVFITWKLISWAGEPMGFGAVTSAAAGATQTALTVAAAGAGAAAGIGGAAGGGGAAAGGTGAIGGTAGSTGSTVGSMAPTGSTSAIGGSSVGSAAGAGSAPSSGSALTGGGSGGLGVGSGVASPDGIAGGSVDGPAAGAHQPDAGSPTPGVPGAGTSGPGQGMAADGGQEPMIARSANTGVPAAGDNGTQPSSTVGSDPSAVRKPTTQSTGSTGDVLGTLGGRSPSGRGGRATPPTAGLFGTAGEALSPSTVTDSVNSVAQSGPLGGIGGSAGSRGVSTALSLATGDASVDQVLAERLERTAGGSSSVAGGSASSGSEASDDSGVLSGSVVSKTATTFTMNQGGRALRRGGAVAKDVGSEVVGTVADEPSRVVGGALGGAAGSSVGGPVGTAVGTVVGSEAVRVGASAAMEYGYKKAYERVGNTDFRSLGNNAYSRIKDWLGLNTTVSGNEPFNDESRIGEKGGLIE
jgi:hypothetical protein